MTKLYIINSLSLLMSKLIHKDKVVLPNMKYATGLLEISRGLMFAGKKRVKRGVVLVMPSDKDVKFGSSVTMFFCFYPLEILFVNSKYEVVDKKILRPWVPNYTPKEASKYIIESEVGSLKNIKIGDKIKIEL